MVIKCLEKLTKSLSYIEIKGNSDKSTEEWVSLRNMQLHQGYRANISVTCEGNWSFPARGHRWFVHVYLIFSIM